LGHASLRFTSEGIVFRIAGLRFMTAALFSFIATLPFSLAGIGLAVAGHFFVIAGLVFTIASLLTIDFKELTPILGRYYPISRYLGYYCHIPSNLSKIRIAAIIFPHISLIPARSTRSLAAPVPTQSAGKIKVISNTRFVSMSIFRPIVIVRNKHLSANLYHSKAFYIGLGLFFDRMEFRPIGRV